MNDTNELGGYNEKNAVRFIRADIPESTSRQYSDDDILYVVDSIWDFYEKRGLTSLDNLDLEDDLLDEDDLIMYVKKEIASDKTIIMEPKDIEYIVKAELNYEKSLEELF